MDESFAQIMAPYPVRVLNEPRLGVSIARNLAVRNAAGEILVFVDDDIIAHPGWLHELVRGFEDPAVACVTGMIVPQGTSYFGSKADEIRLKSSDALSPRSFDNSHPNWFREVLTMHFGSGCNMAFRKSFLIESTPLPEDLGAGSVIGSNDDTYMFLQVVKHGFHLQYIPTAVVTHEFDMDARSRNLRMRQLHSSAVGFGIKLLVEEKSLRWSVAKWMTAGLIKHTLELFRRRGSVPASETLSSKDKLLANLRGIFIYWKAHRSRR
jgi:GT2 family glycosyltransferase